MSGKYDALIDTRTVDTHMRRLREKLGERGPLISTRFEASATALLNREVSSPDSIRNANRFGLNWLRSALSTMKPPPGCKRSSRRSSQHGRGSSRAGRHGPHPSGQPVRSNASSP
jgi:hypothetical protein